MTLNEARHHLKYNLKGLYDEGECLNIIDLIIEHLTGWPRTESIKNKEALLNAGQAEKMDQIIRRLQDDEPVQYILGEAWFAGMKFFVDKNVLIPRPETEELVEWICNDQFATGNRQSLILDIGTGSGCISIALKKKIPAASVTAADVCSEALFVAANNAINLEAEVAFILLDFLDEKTWAQLSMYDVIVSNPPYIKYGEANEMPVRVTRFEPGKALFVPDNDSMIFYKAIADFGKGHLAAGGSIYMEINESLGGEVKNIFREKGYSTEIRKDMQGKERMIKVQVDKLKG